MGPVEDRNATRLPCVICGAPGTVWLYHPSRARQRTCTGCWAMMNGRNPNIKAPTGFRKFDPTRKATKHPIPRVGSNRYDTYFTQAGRCHYCQRLTAPNEWTVDHKLPQCRGGARHNSLGGSNLVGCCDQCNSAKGKHTYEDFMKSAYVRQAIAYHLGNSARLKTVKLVAQDGFEPPTFAP